MAELEKVSDAEAKATARKRLKPQVVSKVDTTATNVVKWVSEGRELFFEAGDDFLELPDEVIKLMSQTTRQRYSIERDAANGVDVVGAAMDGINGFSTNFNVRGDDPNRQLTVKGKKANKDYHWVRPDKFDVQLRKGWEVDHDKAVGTVYDESCNYKTVGGQNQPELVLMSRGKEVGLKEQAERKARRDGSVSKAQNQFRHDVETKGGRAIVDTTNG